ncbi:MAG: tetratricopeptide repeat protein [Deltaproteobacteria bacterium]
MAFKFCPECGTEIESGNSFCISCGHALAGKDTAAVGGKAPAVATPPASKSGPIIGIVVLLILAGAGGGFWFQNRADAPERALKPGEKLTADGAIVPVQTQPQPQAPRTMRLPDEIRNYIAGLASKAEANPDDLDAWESIAGVYYRASRLDRSYLGQARSAYEHLLGKDEQNLTGLRGLGNLSYDQGQREKAADFYERYLVIESDNPDVRTDLGTMRFELGDADAAIAEWDTVIAAHPEFYQAWFNRGIVFDKQGRRDEALEQVEKAYEFTTEPQTKARLKALLEAARESGSSLTDAAQVAAQRLQAQARASAPAGAGMGGKAPALPATAPDTFRGTVEFLFRTAKIAGPKVVAVVWPSDELVRVEMASFPMEQMPPVMRHAFLGKMTKGLREAEAKYEIEMPVRVEIVDKPTGKIMAEIPTEQ